MVLTRGWHTPPARAGSATHAPAVGTDVTAPPTATTTDPADQYGQSTSAEELFVGERAVELHTMQGALRHLPGRPSPSYRIDLLPLHPRRAFVELLAG